MSNNFKPITFASSQTISNSSYRKISTDNDIALSKIVKTKSYDQTTETDGFISLKGDKNDSKILRLPLIKQNTSEIASYDNIIFLDTSNILSAKINGKLFALTSSTDNALIKEVSALPDPSTLLHGYSTLVIHAGSLKWYDSVSSSWKTVTST